MLTITVITLFPEMVEGPLNCSLVGKALTEGKWKLRLIPLRSYGIGKHQCVDDQAYGGGPGMVLRPDVVDTALVDATEGLINPRLIFLTPRGQVLRQSHLWTWVQESRDLVLLCGRYEGVDQRVIEAWGMEEISLGDFVLCGGELPALVLIEGCVRLLEGVVHNRQSLYEESFSSPLLEYPQYTRPPVWQGRAVPPVLLSGHHQHISQWRQDAAKAITQKIRPDLWEKYQNCGKTE